MRLRKKHPVRIFVKTECEELNWVSFQLLGDQQLKFERYFENQLETWNYLLHTAFFRLRKSKSIT